jgi:hypothetical protein
MSFGVFDLFAALFSVEAVSSDPSSHDSDETDELGFLFDFVYAVFIIRSQIESQGLSPERYGNFVGYSNESFTTL